MKPNANDLAVLALLHHEDLHTYEMARRLRDWQIDVFTGARRPALYHAVERLVRDGLVSAVETRREGRRPERTVYRITPAGLDELVGQLRTMVAEPAPEYPSFAAALTFLSRLEPADARDHLELRAAALAEEVDALETAERTVGARMPAIYLIELSYALAVRRAELAWVRDVLEQLAEGRLTWDPDAAPAREVAA